MASSFLTVVFLFGFAAPLIEGLLPSGYHKSTGRDTTDGRLPRNALPTHYNLEVNPNIYLTSPPFPFDGSVTIYITCKEASNYITVNARGLTIISSSLQIDPNSNVPVQPLTITNVAVDSAANFVTFTLNNDMVVDGSYILSISYNGVLGPPTARGFYYDQYVDNQGITRYMAVTQLESIFARDMYPSFDEPDLKATFNVTVIRQIPMVSFSNMPLLRTEVRPQNNLADVYDTSPKMSTYQICVCVGLFVAVEADWRNVTTYPVRIIARQDVVPYLEYAARVAPIFQAWLEEETGIPYGLPKMDHIALPSKGGAMENWGLITYGEGSLCVSPYATGATQLMSVASIIAHELAHQWYGNLVTTKWWDDIWLNEGFATYYNYYPTETINWPVTEGQQTDPRRGTGQFLDIDQRNNSDPVVKPIDNVWQAPDVFSGSTYPKGGALVRSLRGLLSADTLRRGLTRYLTAHQFDVATTDDLWAALTEQAAIDGVTMPDGTALDVKTIMDPWARQMGYPILHIESLGDGTARVTSERFFNPTGQTPDIPSAFNYEWNIPITIATAATTDWDNVRPSAYYMIGDSSITVSGVPTSGWMVANVKQNFFYRVHYDAATRAAIADQLNADAAAIPAESRRAIVDDIFTLARIGQVNESDAMEFTRYLSSELAFGPWNAALKYILYADRIFRTEIWFTLYRNYMVAQLGAVYNITRLTFSNYPDNEPPLESWLRDEIATGACYYGDALCLDDAIALYFAFQNDPSGDRVNVDALPTALCYGISRGGGSDWITAYEQYQRRRTSFFNDERYAYLFGMACTNDVNYINIYLNYIIGGINIDTRDQTQALLYLVQNNNGLGAVWAYLRNSWQTVPSSIGKFTVLRSIASTWYSQQQLDEFETFVTLNPPANESQNQLLIQIRLLVQQNIRWYEITYDDLSGWLANQPLAATSRADVGLPTSPYELLFPSSRDWDE